MLQLQTETQRLEQSKKYYEVKLKLSRNTMKGIVLNTLLYWENATASKSDAFKYYR